MCNIFSRAMAEFIQFEAEAEDDQDFDKDDEAVDDKEIADFLDDSVDDNSDNDELPPNPYLVEPVRYTRGLESVIKKVWLLMKICACLYFSEAEDTIGRYATCKEKEERSCT